MTLPLSIQITVSRQLGSGGSELEQRLSGRARLLKVFVHALRSFRIARMMKFYGAANQTAAEEIVVSLVNRIFAQGTGSQFENKIRSMIRQTAYK